MKTRLFLVAVAATASLAGCGAEDTPTSAGQGGEDAANRKAMLDFARCMRKNGVDMPDPQFEGGRVAMRATKSDPDTMRAAETACAKYRDQVKAPEISDAQREEFKKSALANARCMREHGVDMPDPQFDSNGGARMTLGAGIDPNSPKFKAAQEACRGTMPAGAALSTAGKKR